MTTLYTIGSVLIVSIISLCGVLLLALSEKKLQAILLPLVGFAAGALLGGAFLHLFPEVIESSTDIHFSLILVLSGMLFSFIIEKYIHWHHCHKLECEIHVNSVGTMMLIGDAVHNFLDGILIATSYLVSIQLGIATTIAVILHEIPQEIGDFAVLLHSGYSKGKALFFNFLSAITAILGAILILSLSNIAEGIEFILLPIMIGNFLYIAGSDLLPELRKENNPKKSVLYIISILLGIGLMWVIAGNHSHGEHHEHDIEAYEVHNK